MRCVGQDEVLRVWQPCFHQFMNLLKIGLRVRPDYVQYRLSNPRCFLTCECPCVKRWSIKWEECIHVCRPAFEVSWRQCLVKPRAVISSAYFQTKGLGCAGLIA